MKYLAKVNLGEFPNGNTQGRNLKILFDQNILNAKKIEHV